MTTKKIAIIGAGNMGQCLLEGLVNTGYPPEYIIVTEPSSQKLNLLKQKLNNKIYFTEDNKEAVNAADVIIFAVKPFILPAVLAELAPLIQEKEPLVLSVAAAISTSILESYLGPDTAIIRAMPNTPALIRCGITALFANPAVTPEQKAEAESILYSVGTILWIDDEKLMDVVTAVSGSGPAYFFLIMEALQLAGEKLGLPADVAKQLVIQTAHGAARMAIETDQDVKVLRQQVTSPGGTTEQAVKVLEEAHIQDIFKQAISAAYHRSFEIVDMLTKKMES